MLRPTAIKVLSWAFLESRGNRPESWFLAEARSVARINHPAVVQVYSAAKHGAYCYIAMEYVEGVAGDAMVARKGPLLPADATQAVLQIAGALDLAHASNIIHRDVKPANILLKADGTAKLGDFGMALHSASAEPNSRSPMGTPFYMSPEIWQGSPATHLTDIYALGATYFHLLAGHPPFESNDLQALIELHLRGPIPDLGLRDPIVGDSCAAIIRRCMAKSPVDRYQSAQELGWDLRGVLRRLHTRPPFEPTPPVVVPEVTAGHAVVEHAVEPWVATLGLSRRPFTDIRSSRRPYPGEPFKNLRKYLRGFVQGEPGRTLLVSGEPGSGRTSLVRQALADAPAGAGVTFVDVTFGGENNTKKCSLAQWVCRAVGALPNPSSGRDPALDGLVDHLSCNPEPTVLVLDPMPAREGCARELLSLVRVARSTMCMTLIVVAGPDLAKQLVAEDAIERETIATLDVPALEAQQTASYITAWLEVTRAPLAPPLLFTPDACTLVHHRCQGNLLQINRLASNILMAAAVEGRRVLPSWYAWLTPMDEDWKPDGSQPMRQPGSWPTPEVIGILNLHRDLLGIAQRRMGCGDDGA
jgi:type II secretory pathway predicted ATPase ExeA